MSVRDVSELGTILGVWAHPDDETYLSGGLMTCALDTGAKVVCATATRGEAGSQDEARWPVDQLVGIREAELEAALAFLGPIDHRWLEFIDGACDQVAQETGVDRVAALVKEVEPDTVLTFGAEGMTGHPDHKAVHRWTKEAFSRFARSGARLFYATTTPEWAQDFLPIAEPFNIYYEPDTPPVTPRPELGIDLPFDGDVLDKKWNALVAQTSQTESLIKALGQDAMRRLIEQEVFVLGARA
jgi:LmbE family N-acetylglucosaminyl deacetylase